MWILNVRPAWAANWFWNQPGLCNKSLSKPEQSPQNKQDQSITKGNMLHYYIYITFSNDKILERKKILVDFAAEAGFKIHAYSIGSIRIITVVVVITHVQKKID